MKSPVVDTRTFVVPTKYVRIENKSTSKYTYKKGLKLIFNAIMNSWMSTLSIFLREDAHK